MMTNSLESRKVGDGLNFDLLSALTNFHVDAAVLSPRADDLLVSLQLFRLSKEITVEC